jgi:Ino eighty subunit 1
MHLLYSRAREIIIKRPDGQMLTRADVQYDFLHYVFSDTKPVFTNPFAQENQAGVKVPFADLYLSTLRSSARVTRTLVDLLNSNRDFAIEMAKLAFLINVGRLDTTVSCKWFISIPSACCMSVLNYSGSLSGDQDDAENVSSHTFPAAHPRGSP